MLARVSAALAFGGMAVSAAQAPTTYMADLSLRENSQSYEISARNSGDIAKALRDHGVISAIESGYRSGYVWQLAWTLTPQQDAQGCHVRDMKVQLTSIMSLPHWAPPAGAPAPLIADWQRFDSALRGHLGKQRSMTVSKAQQLRARVMKLQAKTCESLQRGVDFIGQGWIEEMHRADDSFARVTKHGEADNVRWPPARAAPAQVPAPAAVIPSR